MKKMLLLFLAAFAGLSASAQFSSKSSATLQTNAKPVNVAQSRRSFQPLTLRQDLKVRSYAPLGKRLTLDPAKVVPVKRTQRMLPAIPQSKSKALAKGKAQSRSMLNLQPTLPQTPLSASRAKASRKASAFAESYIGMAVDYRTGEAMQWTMKPATLTGTNADTGETENVDVLVDVIPAPSYLSSLYPEGIPVEYSVSEDGVITILPQAIASYQNAAKDSTIYITLFSVNSDDEDGIINMQLEESGKLSITNGNWICFGEFANVEFDLEMGDGDAFLGWDELYANVSYFFRLETTIEQEYKAHGLDYFANQAVDWVMQRGVTKMDDEESHFFVNMVPLIEDFADIYPDGIDVEYEQEGNTLTVKPQVIAGYTNNEGNRVYIMLFSASSEDGNIVLTEDEYGLNTIEGESIAIGAWSTNKYDATFSTYLGGYVYIDNPMYRLPDAPAVAPKDVAFEPNELVLFATYSYSFAYSYNDNLAVMGAYAPTTFRNATTDTATGFDWSVTEYDEDENGTIITGKNRDFSLYTKGGAVYEDFSLTAYNEDAVSEPYTWGVGHALYLDKDEYKVRYDTIHAYAGGGASSFVFPDGSQSVMTRQNPDYDLAFYPNWGTNDILEQYESSPRMSTIYSYQGKPATPLYLTGVTLPMLDFKANDDFNLHIKLCKCTRTATGNLTLGDVIAEGDATTDNVNNDYAESGLPAVEFTELYVEDEFGMTETVDYLFIEDEFVIVIEGWDNGTFSGILGSHEYSFNEITSTWFQMPGENRLFSYNDGWPQLFIGLLDATYGYLHTEDDTDLLFAKDGGTSSIHIDPMIYSTDEETDEPTCMLAIESIIEDEEEVEEIPEWLDVEVANEDYTTATEVDEESGKEHEYFVNGIDYDLVFTTEALPEGVENRTCQIVFFQPGAKLTVTVTQDIDPDGIRTVVEKTPIKNSRAYNVAGQQVGKNHKGVVVKDGKKFLVK